LPVAGRRRVRDAARRLLRFQTRGFPRKAEPGAKGSVLTAVPVVGAVSCWGGLQGRSQCCAVIKLILKLNFMLSCSPAIDTLSVFKNF